MRTRFLGRTEVGAVGYGAMPLDWEYGQPVGVAAARAVVHRALDLGVTLLDTADAYGPFTNESLLGEALAPRRSEAVVATKVGLVVTGADPITYRHDGRPDHIRRSCEESLARLRTEVIDLYQLHRIDPQVPVEESVGTMAELVTEGKVRAIGLSEVGVTTLDRVTTIHPLASVQSELSLWSRDALDEVVPWCDQNGVAFLAYSPLGRGFLSGKLGTGGFASSDFRSGLPRFSASAMKANQVIVDGISAVAARHGATNSQVALAWLLARSPRVIPLPGTKTLRYLEENAAAAELVLDEGDLADLDRLPPPVGDRY